MVQYVFRDEPLTIKAAKKAKPQVIGDALSAIATANGGRLTPVAVVDSARDPSHPLHVHFEWDDAKAAESFRLEQAREIIRVVRVEDDEREPPRAFLSVSEGRAGTSYRTLGDVMDSAELQNIVLAQAERDLVAFQRRYAQLVDVCDIVAKARDAVAKRRGRATSAAA